MFMRLYEIRNSINNAVYVGITRNSLEQRYRSHKHACKRGDKTPLYCMMRKYGFDKFEIVLISVFQTEEYLLDAERSLIKSYRESGKKCLNILDGGESYFPIKDWEEHKAKLRKARAGRKPSLGMKHSEENKKKFSESGKKRWDIYGRYPDDVLNHGFTEANRIFGISKTHYYRLRKLAQNNELS
jgi:group I intron endonuclease